MSKTQPAAARAANAPQPGRFSAPAERARDFFLDRPRPYIAAAAATSTPKNSQTVKPASV